MLRAPGESLSGLIDKISEDIDIFLVMATVIPLLCFSTYLSTYYLGNTKISWIPIFIVGVASTSFCCARIAALIKKRGALSLGLDCERAVGEELNQLMLNGFRVYHDFPAENFNIDHIVIGTNGVFAVETKGRAKPVKGDVNVIFDGQGLQFPAHYEKDPFDQAKRQAVWLAKWLTSAVGAEVSVRPVLVLPGWFIERKKPGMLIYNGKNPQVVYRIKGDSTLSAEMIQRITHQIEQKCRDVTPVAYKKEKKSN
jgi:hypothetical protein